MWRNYVFVQLVSSELSNYDTISRCVNTVVILLGGVIRDNPWVVQAEMEGCEV